MANVQINDLPLNLNPPATSELELQLSGGGDSQKATLADLWANGAPSANDGEVMRYETSSGAWESSNGIVIADGVTSTQITVNPTNVQTSQLVVTTSATDSVTINSTNLAGAYLRMADANNPATYNYIGINDTALTMGRWAGAEFARFSNAGNFIVGRTTVNDSYRMEAYTASGPARFRVLANAGAAEMYVQAVDTDNSRLFFGNQVTQAAASIEWINATNRMLIKAQGNNSTVLEFNASGSALFSQDVVSGNRVLAEDGTGPLPAFAFTGDEDTGMLRGGPDQIDLSAGGASRLRVKTASVEPLHPVLAQVGSQSNPAYSFSAFTGHGMYAINATQLGIAVAGQLPLQVGTDAIRINFPAIVSATDPTLTLVDINTGSTTIARADDNGSLILIADANNNGPGDSFISFRVDGEAAGNEVMRLDDSGNVSIGLVGAGVSTFKVLEVGNLSSGNGGIVQVTSSSASGRIAQAGLQTDINTVGASTFVTISVDNSEGLRVDAATRVGLQANTPSSWYNQADDLVLGGVGNHGITVRSGTTNNGHVAFADGTAAGESTAGLIRYSHSTNEFTFWTSDTLRMTLNATGLRIVGDIEATGDIKAFQP